MDYKITNFLKLTDHFPFIEARDDQWARYLNNGIVMQLSKELQLFARWMSFRDLPFVYELEHQIFPSPWSVENFLYELNNRDNNISFVGLIEGQLVTYAISYIVHDEIHISNLAVAPEFRRLKIGETMLKITLQIGLSKKCQIAHLEVRKRNTPAIYLYQKYGFQIVGVRKNYYQNEKEDALLMTRKLAGENVHGMV